MGSARQVKLRRKDRNSFVVVVGGLRRSGVSMKSRARLSVGRLVPVLWAGSLR